MSTEVPFEQGIPQLFLLYASKIKSNELIDKSAIAEAPVLSPTHNNADVAVFWMNVHKADKIFFASAIFFHK